MPLTLKDASGADVSVSTPEEIAEMITGAVRSQTEKANKKFHEALVKEVADSVKSSLDEYETARNTPDPEPQDPGHKGPSPELVAMQKRLEDAEKKIQTSEAAREAAEKRQRDDSTRASVVSLLTGQIRPEAVKVIADHIFQNSVEFDEGGSALFKMKKAAALGMPEEDMRLPLDAGIKEFLKNKDNEWLIPTRVPATPQKPGPRMPQGPLSTQLPKYDQPATSDDEKVRRAMEREQIARARLGT